MGRGEVARKVIGVVNMPWQKEKEENEETLFFDPELFVDKECVA